jgi:type IV secretion system protein VirB11
LSRLAALPGARVYLAHYLASLEPFLVRADVTDIYVNKPGELCVETLGGAIERHDVPALDAATLLRLAEQVAAASHQGINREHPLLAATLPDGARAQFIAPPATRDALVLAIRKHRATSLGLDNYAADHAFDDARQDRCGGGLDQALRNSLQARDFVSALRAAVEGRLNILIAGGTSTGKTTFLNALLKEVPSDERLVLIEDTPELDMRHANSVGLIAARSALGEAIVNAEDLLNASLRMRPDRIILGELRGPEAFTFLRAVNTGHPGSMTTIHADSPVRAIEQLALLVLQSGTRLDRESITHYVRSSIDVFVQLDRKGGRRFVADVVLRDEL